jgi:hypothetical protein
VEMHMEITNWNLQWFDNPKKYDCWRVLKKTAFLSIIGSFPLKSTKFRKIRCTQYYQILYSFVCKKCCPLTVNMGILREFCKLALKIYLLPDNSALH